MSEDCLQNGNATAEQKGSLQHLCDFNLVKTEICAYDNWHNGTSGKKVNQVLNAVDDRLSGWNFIFQIIEHAMFVFCCIWLCLFHNIISFKCWYTISIRLGVTKSNTYLLVTVRDNSFVSCMILRLGIVCRGSYVIDLNYNV